MALIKRTLALKVHDVDDLTLIRSSLQWALYLGAYDIALLLLDKNANGAHVSCLGWSPLVYLLAGALRAGKDWRYDIMQFLNVLNHDRVHIDTEAQNLNGDNALQLAAAWFSRDVLSRILRLGASITQFGPNPWRYPGNPIWNAIDSNNCSAFQFLLQYYPDVDARDLRRATMIIYTARNGQVDMTELLLQNNADDAFPAYNPSQLDENIWEPVLLFESGNERQERERRDGV